MAITDTFEGGSYRKISIPWTSDSGGAATVAMVAGTDKPIFGFIVQVEFVQGTTPTTGYDVTLTNSNGTDVLLGAGANIASASNSIVPITYNSVMNPVMCVSDLLTLNVTNAGNAKSGTVVLYVKR